MGQLSRQTLLGICLAATGAAAQTAVTNNNNGLRAPSGLYGECYPWQLADHGLGGNVGIETLSAMG